MLGFDALLAVTAKAGRGLRNKESTGFRLMRQIWAVACGHPQLEFTKEQLVAQLKAHPEVLLWNVYKNDQHKGSYRGFSCVAHLIAKCKEGKGKQGISYVTDKGRKWVKQNLKPEEQ